MIAETMLERAETALALAAARLVAAQVDAVLGERYDDREYDRLVLEYRRARRVADSQATAALAEALAPAPRPVVTVKPPDSGAGRRQPVSGMKVGIVTPAKGLNAPRTWAKCSSQLRPPQS
jgi:hypothetical protein